MLQNATNATNATFCPHFLLFWRENINFASINNKPPNTLQVMNREEAIEHGMEVQETKHSMKRRSPWHDYCKKNTYMLTLVVEGRMPLLGELKGNADAAPRSADAPRIELSPLSLTILNEELQKINRFYPMVEVWKACIMPDHIHLIVRVKEDMPKGKHLRQVVRGFKTG